MQMKKYILDSCSLISYFLDESGAQQIEDLLFQAENKEVLLLLPDMQYGEVIYILHLRDPKFTYEIVKRIIFSLPLSLSKSNFSIFEEATQYKIQGGIAFPDGFVLAHAKNNDASIVTKDKEFRKFENEVDVLWLG